MRNRGGAITTYASAAPSASPSNEGTTGVPDTSATYRNPVLDGDFSDPDVIRVGDDYWMITSTMHLSPGMTVLHSNDLITWSYAGHCVPDLRVLGPQYAAESMSRFGRGIFAGSLRYHAGRYWVFFTTLDEGFFMTSATHPAGPWDPVHRIWDSRSWDDPCPLWDRDGHAWLVASHPDAAEWYTYLFPMSADGRSIDHEAATILDSWHTSEGNKIFRHDGRYFVLHNEVRAAGGRVAVIMRADTLDGPWEKRVLVQGIGPDLEREPCQGALVDNADGSWSLVTHHGRGGYPEGRPVSVLPVTWVRGWPVANPDPDGVGRMAWTARAPLPGAARSVLQRSDSFTAPDLGAQWQWNHAPHDGAWGLTGSGLRIDGRRMSTPGSLMHAPNTLSQRSSARGGTAFVHLALGSLADGAFAGLGHLSSAPSAILAHRVGGACRLEVWGAERTLGPAVDGGIWLRTDLDYRGFASFSYSADGQTYTAIGHSVPTVWSHYRGSRIALYSFSDEGGGHALFSNFGHVVPNRDLPRQPDVPAAASD